MILKQAFDYAYQFHFQKNGVELKKGTETPFLFHPLAVASFVLQYGGSEHHAAAALLHDTLGSLSERKMSEQFGPEVTSYVFAFADPDLTDEQEEQFSLADGDTQWKILKAAYLNKIAGLGIDQQLVVFCEELHDGKMLVLDMRHRGPQATLGRYPLSLNSAITSLKWYYRELNQILQESKLNSALKDEFQRMLRDLESW